LLIDNKNVGWPGFNQQSSIQNQQWSYWAVD
jgi:hypothetical protein